MNASIQTVRVKYFASIRETLGLGQEEVSTTASTLDALRAELIARGGVYAEALDSGRAVRMALNQALSEGSATLTPGAEVAFFPPVTGG
jgi:molybdopterin synthase sulfur carrier subunit